MPALTCEIILCGYTQYKLNIQERYTRKYTLSFFVSSETHLVVGVGCKEVVGGVEKRGERTDWEEETIFAINCRVEGRKKKNRRSIWYFGRNLHKKYAHYIRWFQYAIQS